MYVKFKHSEVISFAIVFLASTIKTLPCVGHSWWLLILVSVPFSLFQSSLQAYLYETVTCGVTSFDQQLCER